MRFIDKILKNKYLKGAFSMFSLLTVIVTVIIQFTETNLSKILDFNTSNIYDLSESNIKPIHDEAGNHYIFVIDISKSYRKLEPNKRVLSLCNKTIKKLEEEITISPNKYKAPVSSLDVAKLYILDVLLKLKKPSEKINNVFSIWTIGNNTEIIFPEDNPREIDETNIKNLIKYFNKGNASLELEKESSWTDFVKLMEYLENYYKKKNARLIVTIISDFDYSISEIQQNRDYLKQIINVKLQQLSNLPININRVELEKNTKAEPKEGKKSSDKEGSIYISEKCYFEDNLGVNRTDHTILNLLSNEQSLVTDFIFPSYEVDEALAFKYHYANSITKSSFLLKIPDGNYSVGIPFEPPILKLYPKISLELIKSNLEGIEKKDKGKIKQGQGSFEIEIENGDFIKFKFQGRIPKHVLSPTIRIVDRDNGASYFIPITFEKTIPFWIKILILLLFVLLIILFLIGVLDIYNEKDYDDSHQKNIKENKSNNSKPNLEW
ncbi:hypothetical protein [Flavivirga algicola]|uniref:VWA domain-containing protein n=1 Tax=Flavivirga algicola TaxID=2729136 RepID=A0ABX1RYV9_9FLAO|nr:hypothetical protein [Flavivirga algicola]NMH87988.1 hypothetical protein [Flavivirga algicola]